ncbi:hypothetical protein HIM_06088 [Hirsutella minnesotensis 3608]|uniref:Uncharacterized protein n=1 Tax=Hirsutella minnesotensis 3608 TaxID=1043627 RepID=A0A0F7ZZM7_9HYPO|nr:hypothetical protein HIM_06088 [Hirsutella minnesotensis 3608]
MATQEAPLDIRLFEEDDGPEELAFKQIIDSVINRSTSPSQAAAQLDDWVTREAEERSRQTKGRQLTQDEQDSLHLIAPNPSRHIDMITECIARVCSAFPPSHAGHEALVELFQALANLPKHRVPSLNYDDDSHDAVLGGEYTLWPFGPGYQGSYSQNFERQAQDIAYPFSDVEVPGSQVQLRWRNLQAFIARLTTLELLDCSHSTALRYILPSSIWYPDLEERKQGGPLRIAADLAAASHWLEPDTARKWVFGQCKANAGREWNMENWEEWRKQMAFIAGDERFADETRALAASLRDKLNAQE